ncbi:MAG TPA: hypothetical protein VGN20_17215 [Mucilaginibacter sp.]|jgi:hypothetical protein
MEKLPDKRNVKTAQAIRLLADEGLKVDEKDAEIILDFLYFLAKLTVNQYLKEESETGHHSYEDSRSIYQGEHR